MDFLKSNQESVRKYQPHLFLRTTNLQTHQNMDTETLVNGEMFAFVDHNLFGFKNRRIKLTPSINKENAFNSFAEYNRQSIDNVCIFFIGLGDGFYLRELLKITKARAIIVIEPHDVIFDNVISNFDISDIIEDPRVKLFVGTELMNNDFQNIIIEKIVFLRNIGVILHPYYDLISRQSVNTVIRGIKETSIFLFKSVGNSPGDTLIGLVNTINNLGKIVKTTDLLTIKEQTKNHPIVIVSAGPSLNKNIDTLKKLQNHVYIIAATTIQDKLILNGIRPDAIAVLERDEDVYNLLFKDKVMYDNVILFAQSLINNKIYEEYPGEIVTCFREESIFDRIISESLGGINCFSGGSSVAHMNFQIANILEGSPIILLGQDLAYSEDGLTHVSGTIYEQKTKEDDLSNESKVGVDKEFIEVEGYGDKVAVTNNLWNHFRFWFESEISNRSLIILNCTEGGARIKGTIELSLKDAIEEYDLYSKKKTPIVINTTDANQIKERLISVKRNIVSEYEKLQKISNALHEIEKSIRKLKLVMINNDTKVLDYEFKQVYRNKDIVNETSDLFNFIVQPYRISSTQKEYLIGNISSFPQLSEWIKLHEEYLQNFSRIILIVNDILKPFIVHLGEIDSDEN